MTTLFDLGGKIALITGSGRGLSNSVAETMVAQGATISVSSEDAMDPAAAGERCSREDIDRPVRTERFVSGGLLAANRGTMTADGR